MMNIASRCKTLFYRLVAVGLGVTYGFQVFLTVGGAIKLIPMTGVTLPFVSYGGSSIISSLMMFALINGMYNMRQDEGEMEHGKTEKKKAKA
jgi:cell division protein FtsW